MFESVPGFWDHPYNYPLQSHISRLDHGGECKLSQCDNLQGDPIFPRYFLCVTSRE
jgi:hypothetical protein